ncbi:zinc finger MYM-type protein 1-like [Capsicum annuum]|uniref:zinc finger MYM-type protein 1-like n=1 Tax=Capsicum annuum TaxID=4072 RepID=UPI001FB13D13|nr:zinc finger MYM-type protein 1-like [Capsicum annuum]
MENFFKRVYSQSSSSNVNVNRSCLITDLDLGSLKADPGERKSISDYDPRIRDEVRKYYIEKGPCQPILKPYPSSEIGGRMRQFASSWFKGSHSTWLEYSVEKDAAYCLCCYLFKNEFVHETTGDFYASKGFRGWNKALERFRLHVGKANSVHQKCYNKMLDLSNRRQSIQVVLDKPSEKSKRFLLWHGDNHPDVGKVILEKAPQNDTLTRPMIQKDANACAKETLKVIIADLNGDYFSILVDESKDISHKEQMALVLRYVDKKGEVVERFIGLVHVSDTSACSLKKEMYSLLSDHSLSPSKIHGQGYDGASNMKGEINGLKTLIMKDSPSAYYIHCFTHQLQLTLVAIAKKHVEVEDFFYHVTNVLNVVGGSFKRRYLLRHHQVKNLKQLLESGEAHIGQGLNQERGLQRLGDTRWGSHFKTLDNFLVIFSSIVHVLGVIEIEGSTSSDRNQAEYLLTKVRTFKFVFMLHLILKLWAMSNELSKILQKKNQDIVNAVEFRNISKKRLQDMRENGWESLLNDVSSFCDSHDILIPKLDEPYFTEKSKRKCLDVCYSHHLRVEIFCAVIDVQLQELNGRFDVVSSDLLLGMGSLNPVNSFSNFDKGRIMTLAKCYPNEFDDGKLRDLSYQLDTFIIHMRGGNSKFSNLQGIRDLAKALVEANLVETYSLIYLLVKLILILPVATATIERAFSSMKHIKNEVRNSIGDQYLNDC